MTEGACLLSLVIEMMHIHHFIWNLRSRAYWSDNKPGAFETQECLLCPRSGSLYLPNVEPKRNLPAPRTPPLKHPKSSHPFDEPVWLLPLLAASPPLDCESWDLSSWQTTTLLPLGCRDLLDLSSLPLERN